MTVLAEAVLRILESVLNGNVFETAKEVVVVKAVQILANLALKENDFFTKQQTLDLDCFCNIKFRFKFIWIVFATSIPRRPEEL